METFAQLIPAPADSAYTHKPSPTAECAVLPHALTQILASLRFVTNPTTPAKFSQSFAMIRTLVPRILARPVLPTPTFPSASSPPSLAILRILAITPFATRSPDAEMSPSSAMMATTAPSIRAVPRHPITRASTSPFNATTRMLAIPKAAMPSLARANLSP